MEDFVNAIKILINNSIGNINTFDIGIVDSINDTNNTLNITLLRLFQSKYNAYETDITIPTVQLYDIPVMRPNCRNFSLIPEYSVGDRVIVGYTKKDVHTQLLADVPQTLDAYDNYSVQNAIVLGTIPKYGNLPPTAQFGVDTTTTLMHKSEAAFRIDTNGNVVLSQQFPNEFIDLVNIRRLDLLKILDKTYPKIVMTNDGKIEISIVNDKGTYTVDETTGFPKIGENVNKVLAKFSIDNDKNITLTSGGENGDKYGITMNEGNITIKAKKVDFIKVQ